MNAETYSMQLGDNDTDRLTLLGQFYDPSSAAFLESAGVAEGDSIADLGCGHGGVTNRIARQVGEAGAVYAVDASAVQLQIARSVLAHHHNVTFVESAVEDDPLRGMRVDWVYSRFLLMHVGDIRRALRAIADMLSESGALLLEIAEYSEEWLTSAQSMGLAARTGDARVLPWDQSAPGMIGNPRWSHWAAGSAGT